MQSASELETGPTNEESDNRLSVNPNDEAWKDILASWEDGQEYDVRLKIRQTSPGEFEVLALTAKGQKTPAVEDSAVEDYSGAPDVNPAVQRMRKQGATREVL